MDGDVVGAVDGDVVGVVDGDAVGVVVELVGEPVATVTHETRSMNIPLNHPHS